MCPAPPGPARNTNLRKKRKRKEKEKKKLSLAPPFDVIIRPEPSYARRAPFFFPLNESDSQSAARQPDSLARVRPSCRNCMLPTHQCLSSSCKVSFPLMFLSNHFCPTRLCLCLPRALAFRLLISPPLTFSLASFSSASGLILQISMPVALAWVMGQKDILPPLITSQKPPRPIACYPTTPSPIGVLRFSLPCSWPAGLVSLVGQISKHD